MTTHYERGSAEALKAFEWLGNHRQAFALLGV